MSVCKTEEFIADVEQQFAWYTVNAGWDVADRYLAAVESTCHLLSLHQQLGPLAGFSHLKLHGWRFFMVFRPFNRHILFYEGQGGDVIMRRAMHGHRDLLFIRRSAG